MTRHRSKRRALLALCGFGLVLFTTLGLWQVQRRAWKLDLIARVDARIHSPASPVPAPAAWSSLTPRDVEYRHVKATGTLDNDQETLVDALTERGPGFWVITPLATATGRILVNRGFVPPDRADPRTRVAGQLSGPQSITGLLRLSEPRGRILRPNRPGEDKWYSRDIAAIAARRGLGDVAPFFIDADAAANPGGLPIGGLTVVQFRNAHLVYALTWLAMAIMSLIALALALRSPHGQS